jgi:4-amino-4-deoxy-L-arabinose transferase-like glycosyltransferase
LLRGRADDPAWARPALLGLLAATALLYLVDLAASGYGNSFYAAAVQAGSQSWKAFFFGSFDASNFITVDKPPASLWVMDLSARMFGLSPWSILAPQALEGVAAVGLLYATVRRRFSAAAALLAAAVFALTPVAVLMFRFDNPDALLTLLLVAAAYALTRSLEEGRFPWLALAGALIGLAFLTKMLQAFIVVPGFAAVYLLAAPVPLSKRLWQLLAAGAAMLAAAAWWVAIVAVWPASSRPYIGGSQNNSILDLVFGYNGLGRITGNERGSVIGGRVFGTGGAPGGGMWGPTGITRLFGSEMGTQIAWLLPASLLFLAVLLWQMRRARRSDGRRAAVLMWGSWLLVTGLVFSYARGIIHPYYTVVLAPAIGALVGIGVTLTWARRGELLSRLVLAVALAGTAVWAFVLLDRTTSWHPALRYVVLAGGIAVAVFVAVGPELSAQNRRAGRMVICVALVFALAAPAAYAAETASTAHSGALPAAGPAGAVLQGGPGGGGARGRFRGGPPAGAPGGAPPAGAPAGFGPGPRVTPGSAASGAGELGGLLNAGTPAQALVALLADDVSSYRWVAAVVGANSAAGLQLATGGPVMAIGGFNGTDPAPSLAEFEADVAAGEIHYFVAGGGGGPAAGGSAGSDAIASWVERTFSATTVGGVTVYDLTR